MIIINTKSYKLDINRFIDLNLRCFCSNDNIPIYNQKKDQYTHLLEKEVLIQKTVSAILTKNVLSVCSLFMGFGDIWYTCSAREISQVNKVFSVFVDESKEANECFVQRNLYENENLMNMIFKMPFSCRHFDKAYRFPTTMQMRLDVKGYPDVLEVDRFDDSKIISFKCKTVFGRPRVFPPLPFNSIYEFIVSKKNLPFYDKHKQTSFVTTYDHIRASGMYTVNYLGKGLVNMKKKNGKI